MCKLATSQHRTTKKTRNSNQTKCPPKWHFRHQTNAQRLSNWNNFHEIFGIFTLDFPVFHRFSPFSNYNPNETRKFREPDSICFTISFAGVCVSSMLSVRNRRRCRRFVCVYLWVRIVIFVRADLFSTVFVERNFYFVSILQFSFASISIKTIDESHLQLLPIELTMLFNRKSHLKSSYTTKKDLFDCSSIFNKCFWKNNEFVAEAASFFVSPWLWAYSATLCHHCFCLGRALFFESESTQHSWQRWHVKSTFKQLQLFFPAYSHHSNPVQFAILIFIFWIYSSNICEIGEKKS